MFRYARHFARIFNRPLLIESGAFDAMLPGIERVFRAGELAEPEAFVSLARERSERTGLRMEGPVAIVPVRGVLVHRGHYDAECNYLLGYADIAFMLDAALTDPQCEAIVLDIDSPGGEVAGVFDLAAKIAEADRIKPVHAAVNDTACSAAYALASAAREISVTSTARVGSIGVLLRHENYAEYLKKLGVDVTMIAAGEHKTDGNPYEPLTAEVRADLQAEINRIYDLFVRLVAENRNLDEKTVRDFEARVYSGTDSVGLADRLETPDALIERLADPNTRTTNVFIEGEKTPDALIERLADPNTGITNIFIEGETMPDALIERLADPNTRTTNIFIEGTTMNAVQTKLGLSGNATEDDIVNAIDAKLDESFANGERKGMELQKNRIAAILDHENAEGRMSAARELALKTDLDPDVAGTVLGTLPTSKQKADNQFAEMMTSMQKDQEVGAGDGDEIDSEAAIVQRILAA